MTRSGKIENLKNTGLRQYEQQFLPPLGIDAGRPRHQSSWHVEGEARATSSLAGVADTSHLCIRSSRDSLCIPQTNTQKR